MKRSWVRSQSVHSLGYDRATATLEIEYRAGAVYRYFMVPESLYRALRAAPSIGGFVNAVIKPTFACTRVTEVDARRVR